MGLSEERIEEIKAFLTVGKRNAPEVTRAAVSISDIEALISEVEKYRGVAHQHNILLEPREEVASKSDGNSKHVRGGKPLVSVRELVWVKSQKSYHTQTDHGLFYIIEPDEGGWVISYGLKISSEHFILGSPGKNTINGQVWKNPEEAIKHAQSHFEKAVAYWIEVTT